MSIKHRISNAVGERRVKTRTYDIKLISDDLDPIYTREKRLETENPPETLAAHLCRLTGVTDAKVTLIGIKVTVTSYEAAGMWKWVERTILNFLEDAIEETS